MQTAAVISDLYPALNATAEADLHWWTLDQLFAWLSDALQDLDGAVPLFAALQNVPSTAAVRTALSPAGSVAVAACAWNHTTLRPATVAELEALDPAWESATGTPKRFTEDLGPGTIRLQPAPSGSGQLQIVHHGSAPRFTSSGGDVAIPGALSEFLWYRVLASARKQTGETWLPEVATAAEAQASALLAIAKVYWGSSL